MITAAKIYGDFFGLGDIHDVEQALSGVKYEKAALKETVEKIDVKKYFGNITQAEFLELLY